MDMITKLIKVIMLLITLSACGNNSDGSLPAAIPGDSSAVTTQSSSETSVLPTQPEDITSEPEKRTDDMQIVAGDKRFTVTLEDNETAAALTEMLPMTLDMSELNGNEKYYYLDTALPSAPGKVGHISEGDVMLYGDSCIVLFYKSFDTSYSYTKIGHIGDASELADALGTGSVTVSFN